MKLLFLQNTLIPEIIRALSVTFMHSIWQGLLIGILAWGTLLFTRNLASAIRYKLLTGHLFAFISITAYTFIIQFYEAVGIPGNDAVFSSSSFTSLSESNQSGVPFLKLIVTFFNNNAIAFIIVWFGIFLLKCVQVVKSFFVLQRISNFQSIDVSEDWKKKLMDLAARMNLKQNVQFKQSLKGKMKLL